MIGLVLALIVVAIVVTLLGGWIFAIPISIAAVALFLLFIVGWRPTRRSHA
jgi:uncharacterized membrane protein